MRRTQICAINISLQFVSCCCWCCFLKPTTVNYYYYSDLQTEKTSVASPPAAAADNKLSLLGGHGPNKFACQTPLTIAWNHSNCSIYEESVWRMYAGSMHVQHICMHQSTSHKPSSFARVNRLLLHRRLLIDLVSQWWKGQGRAAAAFDVSKIESIKINITEACAGLREWVFSEWRLLVIFIKWVFSSRSPKSKLIPPSRALS